MCPVNLAELDLKVDDVKSWDADSIATDLEREFRKLKLFGCTVVDVKVVPDKCWSHALVFYTSRKTLISAKSVRKA